MGTVEESPHVKEAKAFLTQAQAESAELQSHAQYFEVTNLTIVTQQ